MPTPRPAGHAAPASSRSCRASPSVTSAPKAVSAPRLAWPSASPAPSAPTTRSWARTSVRLATRANTKTRRMPLTASPGRNCLCGWALAEAQIGACLVQPRRPCDCFHLAVRVRAVPAGLHAEHDGRQELPGLPRRPLQQPVQLRELHTLPRRHGLQQRRTALVPALLARHVSGQARLPDLPALVSAPVHMIRLRVHLTPCRCSDAGKYSAFNDSLPGVGIVTCLPCPPGKYTSKAGKSSCDDCAEGSYTVREPSSASPS